MWQKVMRLSKQHTCLLMYAGSAGFMTIWTTLRFFTQRTIFDLVGQQVLAQQLVHGGIAGAGVGVTNYLPKLVFLYVPLHLLPGSPRIKLLLLTIAVNVATVLLLGILLEKILQKFGVRAGALLWTGVVWISAIAGSVFWVQFTNSRNLEVVGGIFLIYLSICYLEAPRWQRLATISLFATALFFADTLQVYMTALPLLLYGTTLAIRRRDLKTTSLLGAGLVAGYVGSKIVFAACAWLFSIHFVQNGGGTTLSMQSLAHGVVGLLKALVHLYSGAADAGKLREVCNLTFLTGIVALSTYNLRRKLLPRRLLLLVGFILVINGLVFVVSGQAQNADTERYLIMTAPALMLLLGGLQPSWKTFRVAGLSVIAIFIAVNGLFLSKYLVAGSKQHFSQDAHLASVARFVQQNPTILPYASMDTAIPTSYLYGSDAAAPLPLSCNGSLLVKDSTFYSQTTYQKREKGPYTMVGVILDGSSITNTPSICSQSAIISQLGNPTYTSTTDDDSIVLMYASSTQFRY